MKARPLAALVAISCGSVLLLPAAPALATFPGTNGKLAFYDLPPQIHSIEPDGTDARPLTTGGRRGKFDPAWSSDGAHIVFASNALSGRPRGRIEVMDADGQNRHTVVGTSSSLFAADPTWSPDGTQMAFCLINIRRNRQWIWVVDADGTDLTLLSKIGRNDCEPDWSPDGRLIAFSMRQGKGTAIATMAPDGSDRSRLVRGGRNRWPSWSPDGAMIAFSRSRARGTTPFDIFAVTVATGEKTQLTDTPRHNEWTPAFSPDGLQVAFARSSGFRQDDIWIMDADGSDPTKITDTPNADEFQLSWQPI